MEQVEQISIFLYCYFNFMMFRVLQVAHGKVKPVSWLSTTKKVSRFTPQERGALPGTA